MRLGTASISAGNAAAINGNIIVSLVVDPELEGFCV
jgi:hypothetical protein